MAVQSYLLRPTSYSATQWNGTNTAEVNSVCQLSSWSFTADNGGTAHTPFGGSFEVPTGTYAVSGNGSIQFLTSEDFTNQFVSGSSWVVSV
jgi:hypothetical protein